MGRYFSIYIYIYIYIITTMPACESMLYSFAKWNFSRYFLEAEHSTFMAFSLVFINSFLKKLWAQ